MCSTHASLGKLGLCLHGVMASPCKRAKRGRKLLQENFLCMYTYTLCCNVSTSIVPAGLLCKTASRAHMVENEADFVYGPKLLGPFCYLPARSPAIQNAETCADRYPRKDNVAVITEVSALKSLRPPCAYAPILSVTQGHS